MGKKIKRIVREIIKLIKKVMNRFIEALLEIIYPNENYCILCKDEGCDRICASCLNSIRKIEMADSEILSYGYYGGVLKHLILNLKYKHDFSAGDILSEILAEYIKKNIDYSNYILTYIPLSKKSKKKRGFNQCEYISKKISRILNIEVLEILVKDKETIEQKKLKKHERSKNIQGAFKKKNGIDIKGYNIILIDDVSTTGNTMMEAYRILQKNSVKNIKLLTLAKSTI